MTDAISNDARFAAVLRTRRQKEFRTARRHSVLVRLLRWGLPAAGTLAFVGFIVSYMLSSFTLDGIDIGGAKVSGVVQRTDDGIIMVAPRVTGTSAKGEPFEVKASKAWQDPKNSKIIHFETVDAELGVANSAGRTHLTAHEGVYDSEHETLRIAGEVRIKSSEGYGAAMHEAFVDFASGALETAKPIVLESSEMRVEATGATGNAGDQRIEFAGPVRMTIQPKKAKDESEESDEAEAEQGDEATPAESGVSEN